MIGLDNGRIIFQKILKFVQPSSFADSTNDVGKTSKKPFATWKPSPAPAEYERIKPRIERCGAFSFAHNPNDFKMK